MYPYRHSQVTVISHLQVKLSELILYSISLSFCTLIQRKNLLSPSYPDKLNIIIVCALRRHKIIATGREFAFGLRDDMRVIEVIQNGQQTAAIPVICHTPSIVALSSHVSDCIKWDLIVLIDEHL